MRHVLLPALASVAALAPAIDDGPLPNRVARAANLVFLRPIALGPTVADSRGESQWGLTAVNEARRRPGVVEDSETWRLAYLWRKGDRTGEWIVEVPLLGRSGGVLDSLIASWETGVMGYRNPSRLDFPKFQSEVTLGGRKFGSAVGLGDVTVGRGVSVGGFDARAWLKLPTGNSARLLGSGGPDAALSVERCWTLADRVSLSAMGAVVAQSRGGALSGVRPVATAGTATLTWRKTSRDTWLLQVNAESRATDTGDVVLDRVQRVASLAYRRKTSEDQDVTFWFSEDNDFKFLVFSLGETGPDFTAGITWRTRF